LEISYSQAQKIHQKLEEIINSRKYYSSQEFFGKKLIEIEKIVKNIVELIYGYKKDWNVPKHYKPIEIERRDKFTNLEYFFIIHFMAEELKEAKLSKNIAENDLNKLKKIDWGVRSGLWRLRDKLRTDFEKIIESIERTFNSRKSDLWKSDEEFEEWILREPYQLRDNYKKRLYNSFEEMMDSSYHLADEKNIKKIEGSKQEGYLNVYMNWNELMYLTKELKNGKWIIY
jgi:hypothetical protein